MRNADAAVGYGTQQLGATKTTRETEYSVVLRVTQELKKYANCQVRELPKQFAAVERNSKLWDVFVQDVSANGNKLPAELKAGILSLGAFVEKHTTQVYNRKATIMPLIEINEAILKGLR